MAELVEFAEYLGMDRTDELSLEQTRCYWAGYFLVVDATQNTDMPYGVQAQLIYDVAADLLKRSTNSSGQYEQSGPNAPNDPMNRVKAVIRRYKVIGV